MKSTQVIHKRHSFQPENYNIPKPMLFRGDGHVDIGEIEPTFPTLEEQTNWSSNDYSRALSNSLNWYALTQEDKRIQELALQALNQGKDRRQIASLIKKSSLMLNRTSGQLLRMAHLGLNLSFRHKKFIAKEIRRVLAASETVSDDNSTRPNIQDRIEAKLKQTFYEFESQFDEWMLSYLDSKLDDTERKRSDVNMQILHGQNGPPGNRCKDLIKMIEPTLLELKLAQSGKDDDLTEAYSIYSKRDLKRMIEWWEQAITDINSFGIVKKNNRKPSTRKRKQITPEKAVSKLKFIREFPALKLKSIDPTIILQSTILYVYNTRTRRLGVYVADKRSSSFDVQGTRITNQDVVASVSKTLRKPEQQLAQLVSLGKPAAIKYFESITTMATKLKSSLNKDSVLLKAFK